MNQGYIYLWRSDHVSQVIHSESVTVISEVYTDEMGEVFSLYTKYSEHLRNPGETLDRVGYIRSNLPLAHGNSVQMEDRV